MQEREMTKKDKAKEKRLKKKYDDSDMKKSMKKQYGDDWKNVYYATIRKKAMEKNVQEYGYKKPLTSIKGAKTKIGEALKYEYMVLDQDGRVMGMATNYRDAEQNARGDNLLGITGRVVKLRRPMSQGRGDRLMGQLPADNLGEGYQVLPNIDKERYTPIQGMEGPFMTVSGKALYYDPQEGSYYDRDTDMFLTYDEFKQYDEPRTGMRSEAESFVKNIRAKIDEMPIPKSTMYGLVIDGKYVAKGSKRDMVAMKKEKGGEVYNAPGKKVGDSVGKVKESGIMYRAGVKKYGKEGMTKIQSAAGSGASAEEIGRIKDKYNKKKTEGTSPHAKGSAKYKKHMAAKHAAMAEAKETKYKVTVEQMKEALSIDDDTSNEEIVASYVRTMLDESMDTWSKVFEEVQFVLSILKEGKSLNPNNVQKILMQRHMQEYFDDTMNIKENVDTLRKIVNNKQYQTVKFSDGSMKVDLTTASLFLQVFDKQRPEIQEKIKNKITTKQGFLSVLNLIYGKM